MSEEKPIDWEHLELDYRTGVLSLRYLTAKYGCSLGAITRRAKRDGWRRSVVVSGIDHRENTTEAGENTLREHPARENTGREHPEAVTAGENSNGENTQKENSRENTSGPVISGPEAGENKKENTGENSKTGCSLTADPEREQPRPDDVLTLGMEYREAQRRHGNHLAHCRLAAGGGRCPQCLELSIQREIALGRFNHAQFLS